MIHRDNWLVTFTQLPKAMQGSMVKISNGVERFYVDVVRVKGNGDIVGRVSNMLVTPGHAYNMDDLVIFRQKHVIEVWSADQRVARATAAQPAINSIIAVFIQDFMVKHGRMPSEQEGQAYFERNVNTRLV